MILSIDTTTVRRRRQDDAAGFTLVEMMVVITLIVLLAAMAIPSVLGMFSAGAENQGYNAVSGLLASARAHALKTNNYVAVHFQMADPDGDPTRKNTYYGAILEYDGTIGTTSADATKGAFKAVAAMQPVAMPTDIVLGQLDDTFIDSGYKDVLDDTGLRDFMTFTVIFSAQGTVVPRVNGAAPRFTTATWTAGGKTYASYFDTANQASRLWAATAPGTGVTIYHAAEDVQSEPGVRALTIFNLNKVEPLNSTQRAAFLNDSAPFLPVNCYTGQLFPRDGRTQ